MRSNKYLLGITALMAAGTFAVACSSGGGSKTYSLSSGPYALDTSNVPLDSCFNPTIDATLTSINLDFTATVTGNDFTLTATGAAAALLPPFTGTKTGNDLSMTATGAFVLGSSCQLQFSTTATGTMTATDEFDANIPLTVTAQTSNQALAVNCKDHEADVFGGIVPFPVLTGVSNGTCQITLVGHVAPQ